MPKTTPPRTHLLHGTGLPYRHPVDPPLHPVITTPYASPWDIPEPVQAHIVRARARGVPEAELAALYDIPRRWIAVILEHA